MRLNSVWLLIVRILFISFLSLCRVIERCQFAVCSMPIYGFISLKNMKIVSNAFILLAIAFCLCVNRIIYWRHKNCESIRNWFESRATTKDVVCSSAVTDSLFTLRYLCDHCHTFDNLLNLIRCHLAPNSRSKNQFNPNKPCRRSSACFIIIYMAYFGDIFGRTVG